MININTANEVDIIIEILRQSQTIRTNNQNKENKPTLDTKETVDGVLYDRSASLRSFDKTQSPLDSGKGHYNFIGRKKESHNNAKGMIEGLLNRMTARDYQKLYEEGFRPEDLTIESLTFALSLIKEYTESNTNKEEAISNKSVPVKSRDKISEGEIKKRMEAEELPINGESIEQIKRALQFSEGVPQLDDKDIAYILDNNLTPSVKNLYKARYSSQRNEYPLRLSDDEWKKLIPQVNEIVKDIKAPVNNELLEDGKWFIENNIPLTKNKINLLLGIKELKRNYSEDMALDRILKGMKEGVLPDDAILIEDERLIEEAIAQNYNDINTDRAGISQLIENIHKISDSDIIRTVEADYDITLSKLIDSLEGDLPTHNVTEELTVDKQARLLTAKRQLEEIRLKMTMEAAIRLEKKGFLIETENLERVVERLRIEERAYYNELYNHALEGSEESSLKLLQLTSESISELRAMPAYILGQTLIDRGNQTIPDLLTSGRSLRSELDKARESYEALFTTPKAEYGDSIKKAFANMSSLLEEMGIEDTEYNQRAIRILGYNRMEITPESINQVKAYDINVNYLLQNLNPGIAIQIIRDGVNPLDVPIEELNLRIEKLNEEGYSSLDKYSAYLYKLEREEGISEAERKAYIGIYRLLYQIEKSDGAALGAVIKSDQEVTLNHLLMALRTNKKGAIDYKIDDGFGTLQELSFKNESISDQLSSLYSYDRHEEIASGTDTYYVEDPLQNEIQGGIVKELLNSLTPWKLHQLHIGIQEMEGASKDQHSAWETLGNMSMEQLLEQIRSIQTNPREDQVYYYEKLRELQEVYRNSDQSISFLNNLKIPCTTNNLMMAGQILNSNRSVYKKLFGLIQDKDEDSDNKTQENLKEKLEVSDKLIDKESMIEAYERLEQDVKAIINEEAVKEDINLDSLNHLKSIGRQMCFLKDLAKREFYQIPIEASGRITNINLTIIRGKALGKRVRVSLVSESLGSIRAEASLKEGKLSGYIASDHIGSLKILEEKTKLLESVAQEEGITIKQMNFCLQQTIDTIYTHQRIKEHDGDGEQDPETERILYRVAKAMIHMIVSAEEADSAVA